VVRYYPTMVQAHFSTMRNSSAETESRDPVPTTLDLLRALVYAFTNTGGASPTPVSTIQIGHEMRRRNQSQDAAVGLKLLQQVGDVQRFPRGFWLPAPTHFVPCQCFSLVVSCLPTENLVEMVGSHLLAHGASRVYVKSDPPDDLIPKISYSEWLKAPESTAVWMKHLIDSATYLAPHGLEGMEFYRHWKSLNPRRWVPGDLKIPKNNNILLARHRGMTGQTNHYVFRTRNGELLSMAELPHDPDTVIRLQFALREMSADNATYNVEHSDNTSLLRITTPVLPTAERRLLSALGNLLADPVSVRFDVFLPAISLNQVAATLAALGIRQRGTIV
jgi:hypothetical protein